MSEPTTPSEPSPNADLTPPSAPPAAPSAPAYGAPLPPYGAPLAPTPPYQSPAYPPPAYGAPAAGAQPPATGYPAGAYAPPAGYGAPAGYGTPAAYGPPAGYGYNGPRTNGLAVTSLVASLVGFVFAWTGFLALALIAGVITGHIALGQIRRTHEKGRGMALAGVIVGWIGIGIGLLIVLVFALFVTSGPPGYALGS